VQRFRPSSEVNGRGGHPLRSDVLLPSNRPSRALVTLRMKRTSPRRNTPC
jgi:hypothetical protein